MLSFAHFAVVGGNLIRAIRQVERFVSFRPTTAATELCFLGMVVVFSWFLLFAHGLRLKVLVSYAVRRLAVCVTSIGLNFPSAQSSPTFEERFRRIPNKNPTAKKKLKMDSTQEVDHSTTTSTRGKTPFTLQIRADGTEKHRKSASHPTVHRWTLVSNELEPFYVRKIRIYISLPQY